MDDLQVAPLLVVELRIEQQTGDADDAVHRRADFVRHHRQESRFGLVGHFGLFARGDEVGLDTNALADVVEAEHPPDDALAEVLRQRLALKDPAIDEMDDVLGFLAFHDLAQAAAHGCPDRRR